MKKKLFFLAIISLIFNSCNSNKVEILGDFVKVQNKNAEFNVFTFDFGKTLTINENGDNYLVTENGNKSIGTFNKGVINLNNGCSILVDKVNNVLIKTCQQENSSDYWPLEKAKKYLSDMKNVKFKEYMNIYLSDITPILSVPIPNIDGNAYVIYDNEGNKKIEISFDELKEKPFFPFMVFGDFNNDNIFPDIATVAILEDGGDIPSELYEKFYRKNNGHKPEKTLFILHAGSNKLIKVYNKEMYPYIIDYNTLYSKEIDFEKIKNNNSILIRNHKNKYDNDYEAKWNGRRYVIKPINLH